MEIGCAPSEEPCAQVGDVGYATRARLECRAFIAELKALLGDPPEDTELCIRANSHDFGTYYQVAVAYDDQDKASRDYAFACEAADIPKWTAAGMAIINAEPDEGVLSKIAEDGHLLMERDSAITAIIEPL